LIVALISLKKPVIYFFLSLFIQSKFLGYKKMAKPLVAILMGSDSDYDYMVEACKSLDTLGVSYDVLVSSAHRTPEKTQMYVRSAKKKGIKVFIAGAGGAAHLAGVIAAETTLPVIGVPIPSTSLNGLDSILAIGQMPGGIPVATMAIGKPGAKNAGLLAAQILGVSDGALSTKLLKYKKDMAREVDKKDQRLRDAHGKNYPAK
jgi:5-(carboxyamino)imidazole ribonucleotide mutase